MLHFNLPNTNSYTAIFCLYKCRTTVKYLPGKNCHICCFFVSYKYTNSSGADSENLDFVAPLEEHRFYVIFCFFGSPDFV